VADILTAADIAELRREWIVDEIDERPEWGSGGAKASAIAAIGAASVALTGLGAGTIKRGTPFYVRCGAVESRYVVTEPATITASAATVYVTPLVELVIDTNDPVRVERYYRSVFNRVFHRLLFSDVEVEDFARRAEERWGARIHESTDPRRMRYRAIGALAIAAKLESTDYESAVIQLESQDGGRGHLERLARKQLEYENDVAQKTTGHSYGITTR